MPRGVPREYKTYRARRTMKLGFEDRMRDQLVPEAITFVRVESLVASGYLDEVSVTKAELVEAINQFYPEAATAYGLPVNRAANAAYKARMEILREEEAS